MSMTTHTHTIFPIKFNYNGMGIETKVLKYNNRNETLYKTILSSAVSDVQQCWISLSKNKQWKLVLGDVDETLLQQIITAVKKHEQVQSIYDDAQTENRGTVLKSA
jgi:hypothetical protein